MRLLAVGLGLAVGFVLPPMAGGSTLIARDVTLVELRIDDSARAMISYTTKAGRRVDVLAWKAVDALAPTQGTPQVEFQLDYTGGRRRTAGDAPCRSEASAARTTGQRSRGS